jgi:hypothetical protein
VNDIIRFTSIRMDISDVKEPNEPPDGLPHYVCDRGESEWLIGRSTVLTPKSDRMSWSFVRTGEKVTIPLYAYRTPVATAASLIPTSFELGARAQEEAWHRATRLQSRPHKKFNFLVITAEQVDAQPDFLRLYLGFALEFLIND